MTLVSVLMFFLFRFSLLEMLLKKKKAEMVEIQSKLESSSGTIPFKLLKKLLKVDLIDPKHDIRRTFLLVFHINYYLM